MNQETLEEKELFKIKEKKEFKIGYFGQENNVRRLGNDAISNIEANDTYKKLFLVLASRARQRCTFCPMPISTWLSLCQFIHQVQQHQVPA